MNPGVSEEAGETARTVVEALKQQPLVLGLFLINVMFIATIAWAIHEQSVRKDQLVSEMVRAFLICPPGTHNPIIPPSLLQPPIRSEMEP